MCTARLLYVELYWQVCFVKLNSFKHDCATCCTKLNSCNLHVAKTSDKCLSTLSVLVALLYHDEKIKDAVSITWPMKPKSVT